MPFEFIETEIKDVVLVQPKTFGDERGFFMETYKKSDFVNSGINVEFLQDNHSKSTKGVLRGFHFQKKPKEQGKLVRCINGKIYDVAVDIRGNSPTFGKYVAYELSDENKFMLWIPKGFAHAFLTLSEKAEILYKVSGSEYSPEHDSGFLWNDSELNITWPLEKYGITNPILSEKDSKLEPFSTNFRK